MNLLFIIKSYNQTKGGSVFAPIIIRDVISEFKEINIDTLFFEEKSLWKIIFNFKLHEPKYKKINSKSNLIKVDSFIQLLIWLFKNKKNYNLFVLHGLWSYIYFICSLFFSIQRKPFCFHPHGSLDPFDIYKKGKLKKNLVGFFFYKFIFNYSSGIIFTTLLESLRSTTFGSKVPKYIASLTSPSKTINKQLKSEQINIIKSKLNIKKNKKILLFLSRIDSKKGLDILLRALFLINADNKSVFLLIAGVGEIKYINYINSLIKRLELNSDVIFLGHINEAKKSEIMQISDLFVLPSLNENFGIAVVESLQNRLPVVITKDVFIHHPIIKEKAGYLCNRDPNQLSKLIEDIIFEKINKDSNIYLNCFNRNFSREKCAEEHFKAYLQMIRNYEK